MFTIIQVLNLCFPFCTIEVPSQYIMQYWPIGKLKYFNKSAVFCVIPATPKTVIVSCGDQGQCISIQDPRLWALQNAANEVQTVPYIYRNIGVHHLVSITWGTDWVVNSSTSTCTMRFYYSWYWCSFSWAHNMNTWMVEDILHCLM